MDKKTNSSIISVVVAVIIFLIIVSLLQGFRVPITIICLLGLVMATAVGIFIHMYLNWNNVEEQAEPSKHTVQKKAAKQAPKECCAESLIHKGFKFGLGFWLSLLLIYVVVALIMLVCFGFQSGSRFGRI